MNYTLERRRYNTYFARSKAAQLMKNKQKGDDSLQNFGLRESEFDDLCNKMQRGDELLFETTFMTHFEMAMNYLMSAHGANRDDAYDIVMNVLIEFRKRVLDGKVKYGNLKFMFTQMCVQRYRREKGKKLNAQEYAYIQDMEENTIDEEVYQLLDKSIGELGEKCRKIIEEIYYSKLSYKVLEEKYKVTAANLRKQKQRCMTKLKMNLRKSLNSLTK